MSSNPPHSAPRGHDTALIADPKQAFISSNSFSYESVAQSEIDDQQRIADGEDLMAMKREARAQTERAMLIRRPFHWWFVMPMDLLIALTPLFFLSKNPFGISKSGVEADWASHRGSLSFAG